MQLSARILTALAVLAFAVAIVAGARSASDEVSAATGTIDALNVGACTSTNADVFKLDNCTQKMAFYQQAEIEDIIEVPSLYATYAHDPKTAAEAPRAIIQDGDLIRISVTDQDRDRRDPVLITSAEDAFDASDVATNPFAPAVAAVVGPPAVDAQPARLKVVEADPTTTPPTVALNAPAIVAEAVFDDETKTDDLPDLEQAIEFDSDAATGDDTSFENSGTYELVFERPTGDTTTPFKPVASAKDRGVVKFFGTVNDGVAATDGGDGFDDAGPFREIGSYISLDEDVISGEPGTPPAMAINVSVPDATNSVVNLMLIYYETSGIEYIQGADKCFADPDDTPDDTATADVDEKNRAMKQAQCSSKEIEDEASFVLHAESDEDAADDKRHLALLETGRFTGVFQGYVRLTDADGQGGETRGNWGLKKGNGAYDDKDTNDGTNNGMDGANPSVAVLGVGSGPVTITYKDSGGTNRRYDIEIDIESPTIQIDSPAHNGRSDDEKPSFIGSMNDTDSGLAANSFQLTIDNRGTQEGLAGNNGTVTGQVIHIDSGVDGTGSDGTGQVRRRLEYSGYDDANPQFGIIDPDVYEMRIYRVVDDGETRPEQDYHFLEADDFDDGSADGEFNGEVEIDFDEASGADANFVFNDAIDFQAVVRDLAGNIGFSDSDATKPRFIDALGEEKKTDRDKGGRIHNVLGFFSSHVVHIDDLDPVIDMDKSVTGFYGLDSDDKLVRDRSAVMVVFDNDVNGDLIDTGTFTVEHDDESGVAIEDVSVDGKLVFLKLAEELASDATPTLSLSEGREIEDLAGNVLSWQEKDAEAFKVNDGILPVFTLTLSGGSGVGLGAESASKLTNAAMDISISSDEDINGSPNVSVVCSNIKWTVTNTDGTTSDKGLNDYISNRTGTSDMTDDEDAEMLSCGGADEPSDFSDAASLSRPGNNWVYAWRNATQDSRKLNDGKIVVVVWGRDRSTYEAHDSTDTNHNWGSEDTEFVLDSTFNSPLNKDGSGGSVQPEADSEVKEPRPFLYLDFAGEPTSVKVTKLTVDGTDVLADLSSVGANRFLYWPDALDFGEHKVEFDARDAADNKPDGKTSFTFKVTARDPFVVDLTAGWNAISFPANPVDTALDAVFTDEAIDRVVGWNPMNQTGPWSIASRIDGVWTTSANFAPLTDVEVRYGYWVHSMAFVKQSVLLEGPINRETGGKPDPIGIYTLPGWNFIGVVDQDGDQTEDNYGDVLQDSEDADVTAKDYMPGFRQAYTWDAIANGYRVLDDDDEMKIGKGIWVFFPDDTTIAP